MICTKCNNDYDLNMFHKDKQKKIWYRKICKQCRSNQSKIYYKKNSEKILIQNKNWYIKNKYTYNAWYKKYQQTEKYKMIHADYNNKKRTTSDWSINYKSLEYLKTKQNNKCGICNSELLRSIKNKVELDHIIPISKWWLHVIDNVQWTCSSCNKKKNCYLL